MDQARAYSSPQLLTSSTSNNGQQVEECGLEGLAANVKLLLKLIQEHNGASTKENDERKFHRMNGMMFILDEARSRVQKFQSCTKKKAELRRCNTDLRPSIPSPKDRRPPDVPIDEKERLRRELNASLVARQSLQAMCSSLGKEKQIMASELARKAQELTEMEDFISDLRAQNEMLMEKLHACSSEQKEKKSNGMEMEGNIVLQERNKALTEQLQRSIDGYRSLKRKLRDVQDENKEIHATMEQMEEEVQAGIDRIRSFKKEMVRTNLETSSIKGEISALEHMLKSVNMKISKHTQKKI
ncbi:putative kinectin-like [Sesbania bispinosa]|nr:putative kinectin-like [Sesbania bispinosa]